MGHVRFARYPWRVHLPSLTSLRFFAALGVVLLHTAQAFPAFTGAEALFTVGQLGVTFFFVLSGFVLTWTHRSGDKARGFYGRRFARVWPLHAVTAVAAAILLLSAGESVSILAAGSVLTLTQAFVPSPSVYFALNAPSWTLSCEAFFYLLFPMSFLWLSRSRRPLRLAVYTFGVIILVTVMLFVVAAPVADQFGQSRQGFLGYTMTFFPPYRFGEFVIGILIGLAVRNGWRCPVRLPVAVGVTTAALVVAGGSLAAVQHPSGPQLASLCLIPFFALLIAAAASSDAEGHSTFLWHPALVRLGRASFALYLVHWLVIYALAEVLIGFPVWIAALIAVGASLVIADLAHSFVEAPLERKLRRMIGARRSVPS